MTIKEALFITTTQLKTVYPLEVAPSLAAWIIQWLTNYDHALLIARGNELLSPDQTKRLEQVLCEHLFHHKPLAYTLGTVPFLGLDFTIRPPVLIPRSETEYWCSWLIERLAPYKEQPLKILDLCSGSGCIGITLAQTFPHATVYAVDNAQEAYTLTIENAQRYTLSSFHPIFSDLYQQIPPQKFDLIVSNPPYISAHEWESLDPSVKEWEDPHALRAQHEGLEILERIIQEAPLWLSPVPDSIVPQLVVEFGYQQGPQVKALCEKAGFTSVSIHKDQAGHDRFISAHYPGDHAL